MSGGSWWMGGIPITNHKNTKEKRKRMTDQPVLSLKTDCNPSPKMSTTVASLHALPVSSPTSVVVASLKPIHGSVCYVRILVALTAPRIFADPIPDELSHITPFKCTFFTISTNWKVSRKLCLETANSNIPLNYSDNACPKSASTISPLLWALGSQYSLRIFILVGFTPWNVSPHDTSPFRLP